LIVLLASASGLAGAVGAQEPSAEPAAFHPANRGKLYVNPAEYTPCLNETAFVRGETVLVSGSGFAAGEAVEMSFSQGDAERSLPGLRADAEGEISASIAIPADATAGEDARFGALGRQGEEGGGLLLRSSLLQIYPDARDSDSDGTKDMCDNCPNAANPGLEDGDGDGLGDACDRCPSDPDNDTDGAGLCGDVDPDPYTPQAS
jgi:hypothetical protein